MCAPGADAGAVELVELLRDARVRGAKGQRRKGSEAQRRKGSERDIATFSEPLRPLSLCAPQHLNSSIAQKETLSPAPTVMKRDWKWEFVQ